MTYDPIETAIRAKLEDIVRDWNAGQRFDWTNKVTARICQLSKEPEWKCGACARGQPTGAEYKEWLYDICWYVEDEECLTHLPLVAECERGPDGSCDSDFQKLLQARADHRLWIFQVATVEAAEDMFKGCRSNVKRFRSSQPGDRYLFAALVLAETASLRFDLYVHS